MKAAKSLPKNLTEYLKSPFFYYHLIGWDPCDQDKKISSSPYWRAFFIFGLVNLLAYASGQIVVILEPTAVEKSQAFICVLYTLIAIGKMVTLFLRKQTLCQLLDEIELLYPRTGKQKAFQFHKFYGERTILLRLIEYSSFIAITMYVSTSLITSIYGYLTRGEYLYLYPIPMWTTFKTESVVMYVICYINQAYGVNFCNISIMATDIFLCHLVILVCMFFNYVANSFEAMEKKRDIDNLKKLRKIVYIHDRTLRMSSTINEVFSISVLMNLAISSLNLCMVGFGVIGEVHLLEFLRHAFLFGLQILQIFNVCYLGMRITECSTRISSSAFHHIHCGKSIVYKKSLLRMMQRSQRPAILNAPLLAVVSLETMRKVLSIAYQFFTLLNSVKH